MWNQVQVHNFCGRNRGGLARLLLWNRIRRHFKEISGEYHVTGLLSFWLGECGMVAKSLSRKYRIPHYCWVMGQDARPGNPFVKRMGAKSGDLLAISDFIAVELKKNHGISPKHIIPLGIDPQIYNERQSSREIDLLPAGSLISLKQFDIFLRIVAGLLKQFPGLRAMLCGSGPEESRLKELAESLGLHSHLRMVGERSHPELIGLMKKSRILVHPSSYEGFSGVCLEALGAGAEVISFVRPMKKDIDRWHVVESEEAMLKKCAALLEKKEPPRSVIPYAMEESVDEVMGLF